MGVPFPLREHPLRDAEARLPGHAQLQVHPHLLPQTVALARGYGAEEDSAPNQTHAWHKSVSCLHSLGPCRMHWLCVTRGGRAVCLTFADECDGNLVLVADGRTHAGGQRGGAKLVPQHRLTKPEEA